MHFSQAFAALAAILFTITSGAQNDDAIRKNLLNGPVVTIEEGTAVHGVNTEPSFHLTLTAKPSTIEKEWKKYLVDRYSFKLSSQREFYQAVDVEMPDVIAGKVSVYSRVDKKGGEAVLVVMLKSEGAYISGAKNAPAAAKLKSVMSGFGTQIYREQFNTFLAEDEKAYGKIEKEFSSASKEVEKLEKDISKVERNIIDAESEIKGINADNKKLQSGITKVQTSRDKVQAKVDELQEEGAQTVDPKKTEKIAKKVAKNAKKLGKADDRMEKAEGKIEKNKDRIIKLDQQLKEDKSTLDRLEKDQSRAEKDLKKVERDMDKQEDRVDELKKMSEKFGG